MSDLPKRVLGKTNLQVSILAVGGYHIGKDHDPDLGSRIIRTAIDNGINFLDNAWCYNSGVSERIMGIGLRDGYREKVVLMTKNHGRDAFTFRSHLEDSLRRLQTEWIDVLQFHEIISDGNPETIYSQGALEEAIKAREEGKIRFIGFTGHRWPHLFKQMLDGHFAWDTAQLPANLLDHHYRSFTKDIIPLLKARNIGVIGMKSLGGDGHSMLSTGVSAEDAISFSLSLPIDTLVSGMDTPELVRQNIEIATKSGNLTQERKDALIDQVAVFGKTGSFEKYKSA